MQVITKKIYVFWHSKDAAGYCFVALAEDGRCLSTCLSESEEHAKTDMRSPDRLDAYKKHYQEGFDLVWRGGPITPATMSEQKPTPGGGSAAFIEGLLYSQFLRALTL
jgi:hypothetical protein